MLWVMRGLRTVRKLPVDCIDHLLIWLLVWWEDVCEDALTSKGLNTQLRVIGGGARNAGDKVPQLAKDPTCVTCALTSRRPDLPR